MAPRVAPPSWSSFGPGGAVVAQSSVDPRPVQSVEGIGNVNGVLPPDTNGDVGPNHFVQWVNLSFAVYSKGTPTTPPRSALRSRGREHAVERVRRPVRNHATTAIRSSATTISPIAGS